MKNIIIFGAGGFGREVVDTIERINVAERKYNIVGFIDENRDLVNTSINGIKVIGGDDSVIQLSREKELFGVIAVSSANIKQKIIDKLSNYIVWENIIDPSACISQYVDIGVGNVVQPYTFISSNVKIGDHCILNVGSVIGHDTVLEDCVSVMPSCSISGNTYLSKGVYIGSNACIIPGKKIAKNCVVGAGALVNKDLLRKGVYAGVPAKLLHG